MILQFNNVTLTAWTEMGCMSFQAKTASVSSSFDSIFVSCCDCHSQDKVNDGQLCISIDS